MVRDKIFPNPSTLISETNPPPAETYLRSRTGTKFNRGDFDCLSNKFVSRLVIRAN